MKPTSAGSKSEMRSASLAEGKTSNFTSSEIWSQSNTGKLCLDCFFFGSIFPVVMLVLQLGHVLLVNDGAALRCADE